MCYEKIYKHFLLSTPSNDSYNVAIYGMAFVRKQIYRNRQVWYPREKWRATVIIIPVLSHNQTPSIFFDFSVYSLPACFFSWFFRCFHCSSFLFFFFLGFWFFRKFVIFFSFWFVCSPHCAACHPCMFVWLSLDHRRRSRFWIKTKLYFFQKRFVFCLAKIASFIILEKSFFSLLKTTTTASKIRNKNSVCASLK